MSSTAVAAPARAEGLSRQRSALGATFVLALPLALLFWLSGAVSFFAALVAMALFVLVVMSAGFLLLRAAGAADMPAPAAWVLGVSATALALLALAAAFDILAFTAFAIWAAMVGFLSLHFGRAAPAARNLTASELVALALCAAATVFWCRELAEVPDWLARDGVLRTWTDQFVHGAVISQFGDPRAASAGAIELARVPLVPYHYASYLLPAAFAWPLDLPGLALATSVWIPLGFLTLCAGTYVLGASLAGHRGGLAALAALTLLPDPASYGVHNRLFGYYWYVLAVPTASYGVGVALVCIALLHRWWTAGGVRALVASALLLAASALVRVHLFALVVPTWLTCVGLSTRYFRGRKLAFVALAAASLTLFVWAFYRLLPDARHALGPFLDVLHNQQHPTAYRGLYAGLMAAYGPWIAVPSGIALILPACLGAFGLLYPVSMWLVHRLRGLQPIDLVPPAVLVWYFLLMVTAPVAPHGDSTEWTQRPVVLVYAVIAVWTAAGFAHWLASLGGLRERRVWLPALIVAALTVFLALEHTVRDWRWSYTYTVAEGLPRAASFLRLHGRPGDVFAVQGLKPGLVTTDLAVQVASLTGMPAYLARPFISGSVGAERREAAMRRYSELETLESEKSAAAALGRLHDLGIQWFVVAEASRRGPGWDAERRQAVFVDGMVAVYSTRNGPAERR
jgi:hypothetical protein